MKQHSITAFQAYALVMMSIIGVSVLVIPHHIGEVVGPDAVWVMVIPFVFILGIVIVITKLCERFPTQSIVEFSEKILGVEKHPWVGKALKIPFVLSFISVWLLITSYVTRTFGEVIVSTILKQTPLEVIIILFIGVAAIAASMQPEVIAKFNELLLPLIFVPLIFIIISWIQQGDMIRLFPLFQVNWWEILEATIRLSYDFAGYSIIFVFMAYYQQPDKAIQSHLWALVTTGLIYWIVMAATISVFGIEEISRLSWPTLETVRVVDIPIQLFQRLESIMISLWMVASFTTICNVYAALTDSIRRSFQLSQRSRKWIALITLPIIFVLGIIPSSVEQLYQIGSITGNYILLVDVIVPSLLFLIAIIRKKRGGSHEKTPVS